MPAGSHSLLRQAKYQCHGHLGIYQQRLACGHSVVGGVYKRNNPAMTTQPFQNPLLNINSARIFFLQLFVIGVPRPYLHRRLDDDAWANARELRGAAEVRQRLHSVMYECSISEDGVGMEVNERGGFRVLNGAGLDQFSQSKVLNSDLCCRILNASGV